MKIHEVQQGSAAWLALRAAIPTASEFGNLVTPKKWEIKKGAAAESYLCEKIAAWWLGMPLQEFKSFGAVEQGTILEEEAIPHCIYDLGLEVQRIGFCTTDNGTVGCSPDGLIGETSGLECKCCQPDTHVGYLLGGVLPEIYGPQVHGSMLVTGRSEWKFLSYCRGFKDLFLTIPRDEKIQAVLETALSDFLLRFETAKTRMIEIHGHGPTERKQAVVPVNAAASLADLDAQEQRDFHLWPKGKEPQR